MAENINAFRDSFAGLQSSTPETLDVSRLSIQQQTRNFQEVNNTEKDTEGGEIQRYPRLLFGNTLLNSRIRSETSSNITNIPMTTTKQERGQFGSVAFAMPFLLRLDNSDRYVKSGRSGSCKVSSSLDRTCLVTFHGRNGDQKNFKGDKELIYVKEGDLVTIFANIPNGGKYLSPNLNNVLSGKTFQTSWNSLLRKVQHGTEEFEFIVHVVQCVKSQPLLAMTTKRRSKNNHFSRNFQRPLSRMFRTLPKGKKVIKSKKSNKTDPADWYGTNQSGGNNDGVLLSDAEESDSEEEINSDNSEGLNQSNRRSTRKNDRQFSLFSQFSHQSIYNSFTKRSGYKQNTKRKEKKVSLKPEKRSPITVLPLQHPINPVPSFRTQYQVNSNFPTLKKASFSTLNQTQEGYYEHGVRRRSNHTISSNQTGVSENSRISNHTQNSNISEVNSANAAVGESKIRSVNLGDIIVLESKLKPGYYLNVMEGNEQVYLGKRKPAKFELVAPELHHLMKLNSSKSVANKAFSFLDHEISNQFGFLSNSSQESENSFALLLRQLPTEILFEILRFEQRWFEIARLSCREWKSIAEQHVRRIRILGNFEEMYSPCDRKRLFQLVRNCHNLQEIVVRNIDEFIDDDFKDLNYERNDNPRLEYVAFGGCTSLGNGCISHLSRLKSLTRLNLALTQITDRGLFEIAKKIPQLQSLNLYACKLVTARGVLHLLKTLTDLRDINIRGTKVSYIMEHSIRPGVKVLTGPIESETIYG